MVAIDFTREARRLQAEGAGESPEPILLLTPFPSKQPFITLAMLAALFEAPLERARRAFEERRLELADVSAEGRRRALVIKRGSERPAAELCEQPGLEGELFDRLAAELEAQEVTRAYDERIILITGEGLMALAGAFASPLVRALEENRDHARHRQGFPAAQALDPAQRARLRLALELVFRGEERCCLAAREAGLDRGEALRLDVPSAPRERASPAARRAPTPPAPTRPATPPPVKAPTTRKPLPQGPGLGPYKLRKGGVLYRHKRLEHREPTEWQTLRHVIDKLTRRHVTILRRAEGEGGAGGTMSLEREPLERGETIWRGYLPYTAEPDAERWARWNEESP